MKPKRFATVMICAWAMLLATHSALAFYNPGTGRWLSRDPIGERGGANLHVFVGNNGVKRADLLGLVIVCKCPEAYFAENGITSDMYTKSGDSYSAKAGVTGPNSGAGLILWRMLLTSQQFVAAGLKVDELKKHVSARQTIVNNALTADFMFGTGQKLDWTGFRDDPQAFFDRLNNGGTTIACKALSLIIFETGNKFFPFKARDRDGVWIPGDWAYMRNKAQERNPDNWEAGLEGENVFHTGVDGKGELFWGHFQDGQHPAISEKEWFDQIRNEWRGKNGEAGDPEWRRRIVYPGIGLSYGVP
jgi:hypothetical protein